MSNKPRFVGERRWVKLSDICSKGKSSLRQKDVLNDGSYAVYGASGIVGTMGEYQNEAPYVAVVKDGAGVGRANACEAKTSVLGTMQALLPNQNVERDYLLHLVRSLHLGKGFSGSTIPHIYFKDYGKIEVSLPSIDAQRQIISQFNAIEQQIAQAKIQIEKLDQLVKSRFVEMFGDPVVDSNRWTKAPLGSNAQLINGRAYSKNELLQEGKYPVLRVGNFFSNRDWYYSDLELGDEKYCDKGDLLYAWSASFGPRIWDGEKAIYHYHIWKIIVGNSYDKIFLCFLLKFAEPSFLSGTHGIGMMHLTKRGMEETEFIVPSLSLQQEFAAFVQQVDKSRFIAQQQIEKLQMLYDSLAQDYFGV